ncbi:unnamed protein product [Blepharisma stoltei]|uniref:Uncharacterized protein n=1 Tax=Blepharisma stoltei TaxID=1481888 RepID=A0AAU9ITJ5_9CILI|nr:unnamed protein product [Blepharisma stoltei]
MKMIKVYWVIQWIWQSQLLPRKREKWFLIFWLKIVVNGIRVILCNTIESVFIWSARDIQLDFADNKEFSRICSHNLV